MSPKISKKHPKSNFAKRLQIIINGETFLSFERKCALPNKSIARYYDGQQPKLDALQSIILAYRVQC
jgi:predicted transcriptional regulator